MSALPFSRKALEEYLYSIYKTDKLQVLEISLLGKGWHAEAWRIRVMIGSETRNLVMKFLKGEKGFGHDYPADRAQVLLLAHKDFNELPNHIKSIDVGYIDRDNKLHSVGDYEEFFILMEEAIGRPYIEDLREIKSRGYLIEHDLKRVEILANYLASIHREKFFGDDETKMRLYFRRIRDLVGHGEMIFGVIDSAYPYQNPYTKQLKIVERKVIEWRWRLKQYWHRLCNVHGDYHPFNIRFTEKDELVLMDRSRGRWGEAADDVSCLAINLLWFALLDKGSFKGPFAELFSSFINHYIKETNDEELLKVIQPWFAFRALVIASPLFYPENPESVRNALINFAVNVLDLDLFEIDKLQELLV